MVEDTLWGIHYKPAAVIVCIFVTWGHIYSTLPGKKQTLIYYCFIKLVKMSVNSFLIIHPADINNPFVYWCICKSSIHSPTSSVLVQTPNNIKKTTTINNNICVLASKMFYYVHQLMANFCLLFGASEIC